MMANNDFSGSVWDQPYMKPTNKKVKNMNFNFDVTNIQTLEEANQYKKDLKSMQTEIDNTFKAIDEKVKDLQVNQSVDELASIVSALLAYNEKYSKSEVCGTSLAISSKHLHLPVYKLAKSNDLIITTSQTICKSSATVVLSTQLDRVAGCSFNRVFNLTPMDYNYTHLGISAKHIVICS
jgi:hypothetical protein